MLRLLVILAGAAVLAQELVFLVHRRAPGWRLPPVKRLAAHALVVAVVIAAVRFFGPLGGLVAVGLQLGLQLPALPFILQLGRLRDPATRPHALAHIKLLYLQPAREDARDNPRLSRVHADRVLRTAVALQTLDDLPGAAALIDEVPEPAWRTPLLRLWAQSVQAGAAVRQRSAERLRAVLARMDAPPAWQGMIELYRASLALLEERLDDMREHLAAIDRAPPIPDRAFPPAIAAAHAHLAAARGEREDARRQLVDLRTRFGEDALAKVASSGLPAAPIAHALREGASEPAYR
jgi:hypothetical protein